MKLSRRSPHRMGFARSCANCALPVTDGMQCCPWCTTPFAEPWEDTLTVHASMTTECAACGDPVREDWSACPWCGTSFAWSLPSAERAIQGILDEAGASAFAKRIELRYARSKSFSLRVSHAGRDDRLAHLDVRKFRGDANAVSAFEQARRWLGANRFFALDHPLHVALHEAGHVFETYLRDRNLLDLAEARRIVGELDLEENPYPSGTLAYWLEVARAALGSDDRSFLSTYATVHPCEDFAETFAVVAFLRAHVPTLQAYARNRRRGPVALRAMEWMAGLLREHGR